MFKKMQTSSAMYWRDYTFCYTALLQDSSALVIPSFKSSGLVTQRREEMPHVAFYFVLKNFKLLVRLGTDYFVTSPSPTCIHISG